MKCPKCGKEIADDSQFCEFCGAQIGTKKNYRPAWMALVVIYAVCISGLVLSGVFYYENELSECRRRLSDEDNKMMTLKSALLDEGYADLGLPSGTLWKRQNESGYYTFDEAKEKYGEKLPSRTLWEELKSECEWTWNGRGYDVTGPNGERISLPSGQKYGRNSKDAFYWSSQETDSETSSYCMFFYGSDGVGIADYGKDNNFSIRLALCIDKSYIEDNNNYCSYEEVVDTVIVEAVE